jgi:predicted small lipoprotein YifL
MSSILLDWSTIMMFKMFLKDTRFNATIGLAIISLLLLLSAGCGAKGALFLPEEEEAKQKTEKKEQQKKKQTDTEAQTDSGTE